MELPDSFKSKSFWERPEGFTGILFGVGALFGLWLLSPVIIAAFHSAVLLGLLAAAVYVLLDPKFRNLFSYGYKLLMKGLTSLLITINPIGILEEFISRLEKKMEKTNELLEKLWGQISKLRMKIEQRKREATRALQLSSKAKQENKTSQVLLNAKKAGRLVKSSRSLEEVLSKAEVMYRVLKKMGETCSFMIEDTKSEVETAKDDYNITNESHKTMTQIKRIMTGDADKEMYDPTMEYVLNTTAQKVGEMEHFMEIAQQFTEKSDLENGLYEEEALKMLEEWEKRGDSVLLGTEKAQLISAAYDPNNILDQSVPASAVTDRKDQHDFKKLFN